jgi:hypothetical protein
MIDQWNECILIYRLNNFFVIPEVLELLFSVDISCQSTVSIGIAIRFTLFKISIAFAMSFDKIVVQTSLLSKSIAIPKVFMECPWS